MNKYDIKLPDNKTISLFYDTIEEVLKSINKFGYETPITEKDISIDTELKYMQYVNEIIDNSDDIIYIKNKKHYLYNSDKGLIPINLWEQDGFYFDGCQYIEGRYDKENNTIKPFEGEYTYPIGWTWSNPEKFLKAFKSTKTINLSMEFISKKKLIKEFKGQLINRKWKYIYKDQYGYYYLFDKNDVNNKEYKQFKDNKDAVNVQYYFNDFDSHLKWFNNIEEFKEMWNKEYESKSESIKSSCAYYKVLQQGYNKLSPDERKVILRLPYFDIHIYDETNVSEDYKKHLITSHLLKKMDNYKHLSSDRKGFSTDVGYENDFFKIVDIIWNIEHEKDKDRE